MSRTSDLTVQKFLPLQRRASQGRLQCLRSATLSTSSSKPFVGKPDRKANWRVCACDSELSAEGFVQDGVVCRGSSFQNALTQNSCVPHHRKAAGEDLSNWSVGWTMSIGHGSNCTAYPTRLAGLRFAYLRRCHHDYGLTSGRWINPLCRAVLRHRFSTYPVVESSGLR